MSADRSPAGMLLAMVRVVEDEGVGALKPDDVWKLPTARAETRYRLIEVDSQCYTLLGILELFFDWIASIFPIDCLVSLYCLWFLLDLDSR